MPRCLHLLHSMYLFVCLSLTNKKAMLSQGNRAIPLWILIDTESAGTLLEQYQSVECSQSVDVQCMRKYSMSEEAEEHVLLRLTYLLACLLHTIITIRVVSNAGLSRSVISFRQFWIWIWIIIANLLTDISAMDSFICWDNILLFISLC